MLESSKVKGLLPEVATLGRYYGTAKDQEAKVAD
jgi:hypothetical protein